jgi:drug/metabolite transporter (DMT)-like permease
MTVSHRRLGLALGLIGVFIYGGTLPATRLAVTGLDPLFLTAARATVAGCLGSAVLLVMRRSWPPIALWREIFLAGLCTIVGFPILMALAMASVPASHGGVVLGIVPLATTGAAALVAHERPSRGFWLVSIVGATIVIMFVLQQSEAHTIALGDLYLLGTALAGAFGYALSGRLSMKMPGWEVISWQVAGFLPIASLATFALWPPDFSGVTPAAWAGFVYVSFVSQYLASFVFNPAMVMAGVARIGQLMLLQPFVIVALAVPVNGEPLQLTTLAYALGVVLTVVVGQKMQVQRG